MPVFIDDWAACRVAISPESRRFDLRVGHDSVKVPSESVARVLLFDRPRLPDVAIANRAYQGAEFEALLVGILHIAGSGIDRHWSYALAGLSEADIDYAHGDEHEHLPRALAEALFALGSGAAWSCGKLVAHRTEQGRVHVLSGADRIEVSAAPIAFRIDARHQLVTPYVGYCPEWICDDPELLGHALAHSSTERVKSSAAARPPVHGSVGQSELTIVAHSSDSPAAHLFYRAVSRGASARLIDLRSTYSGQCSDREFERILATISEAAFVFARPLPARSIASSGDRVARQRHWAILRALQRRGGATLNPPASGYTNLSKAAHLAYLSGLGLPVPPTLATNDQDAAREFIRAHPEPVYKSVSHARSITSRYSGDAEQRLGALLKCPVLFQAFVDGPDYRVHTVGERTMTTRIKTRGTDYRFAGNMASYRTGSLTGTIASRVVSAALSSGLRLSGIDLRISERDGSWFVFEINRMPAFNFYDHRNGSQVADAIIDMARD